MPRIALLTLSFLLLLGSALGAEERAASIDVVVLLDKSLSMAEEIDAAKNYVAGEIVGAVTLPGDRLILELFYGKIDRLFGGLIRSEEDKAAAIRALREVRGDGRFTDIGQALDRAGADLAELGSPERPKWVVLVTDERQEAPWGTPYYAADYVLRHPALEYVKKTDLGGFRAITVGFGVGSRIDLAAPTMMKLLREPPPRSAGDFPDLPAGSDGSLSAVGRDGAGRDGSPGADSPSPSASILPYAVGLGLLALAAIVVAALVWRKRKREKVEEPDGQ